MADLSVTLCGLRLDNPVIPASGTFGLGAEFKEFYDINILGSLVMKAVTREPRTGNPLPRIAECPSGLLNAVGLQNPGIAVTAPYALEAMAEYFHKPVIANVSGFSVEEYAECCAALDSQPQVGIIEINISCPNVQHGGMSFGTSAASAAAVTSAARAATSKPIFVKLSPNVTDITEIALACEAAGADGLSLINTLLGMRIDIKTRRPVLANVYGGLSGPAIFPVALRMVHQVSHAVGIPVMGIGGVSSASDVIEMMLAGATAVQVGSANLIDPFCCKTIIEELPALMKELNIESLSEIIGGAK